MAQPKNNNISIENVFKMRYKQCYTDWDKFCVESLNSAKEEINKNRILRYTSIAETDAERARLRQVTQGIVDIIDFIEEYGWKAFVAVAIGFGVAVGGIGAAAAVGGSASVLGPISLVVGGVAAIGVSYIGYKLYKHRELVVKVKGVLSPIKEHFNQHQPGYKQKNRSQIHILYNNSVIMVIEKVYECEIMVNDLSLPINPICLCGAVLVPKSNEECYGNEYYCVICDICDKTIKNKKDVYHCPRGKIATHSDGYDICIRCARANNTKFKRYHAVIIQSIPENAQNGVNIQCKDAEALKSLFEELNYHEIIILKEHNANRRAIKNALNRMAVSKGNDIVVICYSGHGLPQGSRWKCELQTGETITDEKLVQWVQCQEDNISFGETCDVVILLNACFSGRFRANNQLSQPVIDDEKMPQYLSDYNALGRNMITIAACAKEEEGNFYGEISPFWKLMIEEVRGNKNVTPQSIHQYIEKKSNEEIGIPIKLNEIQNVQRAYKDGAYALYVPLYPAVKKY